MHKAKQWILGAATVAALMAAGAVVERASTHSAVAQPVGDHWRNYNGHWSVWHEADRRWYCTDGRHWFYHDGNDWRLYRFDRSWGREGFVHGDYRVPPHEIKIVLPHERLIIR